MMCCAVVALLVAVVAALRNAVGRVWTRLSRARRMAAAPAAIFVLVGGSLLTACQFDQARQQHDLTALLMQHICGTHPTLFTAK